MMKKSMIFLSCVPFLLSGCGDIEIPESIPAPTLAAATATIDPSLLLQSPTPTPLAQSCTALQEERDNLSEAISLSQEELKTCKAEKAQLESLASTSQVATTQVAQLSPLLKKYITDVPQEEYVFDSCGALGTVTSSAWYSDFQASLSSASIIFSALDRKLEPTDFYSVCVSEEGQTALFLGASSGGENEFHMVKYSYDVKQIEESVLLGGTCTSCPAKFGKRFGPYITLISNNNNKEYYYYYDSNIIDPR